jgi:hypothetical protein
MQHYLEIIEIIPMGMGSDDSSSEDNSTQESQPPVTVTSSPPAVFHSAARGVSLTDMTNASYICVQTTDIEDSTRQIESYRADFAGKNYVARHHAHKHDDHLPCTVQIIEAVDGNTPPTKEELDARLVLSMSTDVAETYELPTAYKVEAKDEDDLVIKQNMVISSIFAGKMVPNISSNLNKKR